MNWCQHAIVQEDSWVLQPSRVGQVYEQLAGRTLLAPQNSWDGAGFSPESWPLVTLAPRAFPGRVSGGGDGA